MNRLKILVIALVLALNWGCAENKTETVAEKPAPTIQNSTKVQVYYFHGDRRCVTCQAVGAVAEATVQENFSANPDVVFLDVNIDRAENEKLAEKFQVSGSGLYLFAHEKIEDLTAFAFQNARTAPEMLTNKLTELINQNLGI
jgi:hypothetical protein